MYVTSKTVLTSSVLYNVWNFFPQVVQLKKLSYPYCLSYNFGYNISCFRWYNADIGSSSNRSYVYTFFWYFLLCLQFPFRPVTREDFFWVIEKETFTKLLLPIGTKKVFRVPSKENQVTLYDDCLKALEYLNKLTPFYINPVLKYILPERFMVDHIRNGPTGRCSVFKCSNPLFSTYYFMVVKRWVKQKQKNFWTWTGKAFYNNFYFVTNRCGSKSKQLFTCYFCTQYCAKLWLMDNHKKYYCVEWEVYDDHTASTSNTQSQKRV